MKWILRIGVSLVVLVVALVAAILLIPTERIAALAADRFAAATGRTLTISGPVKATLWPSLGVRAEGIEIGDGAETLLTARSLDVGVGIGALWGEAINVERLAIDGARLSLRRNADGTGNWESAGGEAAPAAPTDTGAARPEIAFETATLTDAEIVFTDGSQVWTARALDVTAALPDAAGPLTVDASALVQGQTMTLTVRADDPFALAEGRAAQVVLGLVAGGTALDWTGQVDPTAAAAQGRLEVGTTDGAAVLQAFGAAPLDLPAGLGRMRLAVATDATVTPETGIALRQMVLELDDNRIAGDVDVTLLGDRPRIVADLSTERLDLRDPNAASGEEGAGSATSGWDGTAIDVSGLFAADADIAFRSGPIFLDGLDIEGVDTRVTLDAGRMVARLDPLRLHGGRITGETVVNGRGGLSMRTDLDVAGLRMQPLLAQAAGTDRLIAPFDATISLLAVGGSQAALMQALDGTVSFTLGQGEIAGLDVAGMIRNLDPSFRGEGTKTVFDSVSARFAVEDGVASGDNFLLDAPLLKASGEGEIDLGARRIDWRLFPSLRQAEDVTVPIRFTGPWDDMSIRPDLDYVAQQRLDVEKAEAEAAAKRKLAEELNVTPEVLTDRDAIEDAIVDRVRDKLLDSLINR